MTNTPPLSSVFHEFIFVFTLFAKLYTISILKLNSTIISTDAWDMKTNILQWKVRVFSMIAEAQNVKSKKFNLTICSNKHNGRTLNYYFFKFAWLEKISWALFHGFLKSASNFSKVPSLVFELSSLKSPLGIIFWIKRYLIVWIFPEWLSQK